MDALGQYALRLICGALICGILLSMVPKGPQEGLIRFLSGVLLTVLLFSPFTGGLELPELPSLRETLAAGTEQAAAGAEMARQAQRQRISAGLESYILDKARPWDTKLQVTVTLDEDGLPVGTEITGEIPDAARQELSRMITQDLGIPKENQQWIG